MFVVEQPGRIMVIRRGRKLARPFLDINRLVSNDGGERGLLSVAFPPPDYRKSKRFYVSITSTTPATSGSPSSGAGPWSSPPAPGRTVIRIAHPVNSNHNGGRLGFLGHDLYFATGDGGGAGDGPATPRTSTRCSAAGQDRPPPQRKASLHGARQQPVRRSSRPGRDLRLRPPPIPSAGPSRLTSSKRNVRIAIGDVGQDAFEEVNYLQPEPGQGRQFRLEPLGGLHPLQRRGGRDDQALAGPPIPQPFGDRWPRGS